MKFNAALAKSVLMAASIGLVVPVLAQAPARAPGAKQRPAEEEEGVIEGVSIQRPDGRWLGLAMAGTSFKLSFYDDKKMPIAADRPNGTLRWIPAGRTPERGVLVLSSDGLSLVGNRPVKRPWVFKVFLTLLDDTGQAAETYSVDVSG